MKKEDQAELGKDLYRMWRVFADRNSCASYSYDGMSDAFRLAWTEFAIYLTSKKKKEEVSA